MAKKILIIEDDPGIQLSLKDEFESEGFDVYSADDGLAGLEMIEQNPPDLIILDLMLPFQNGYQVCKKLRQDGNMVPIIMLTVKDQEIDKVLGLEFGADDYVTKPYSPRELSARISSVLRRTSSSVYQVDNNIQKPVSQSDSVRFDGWELQPASRRLLSQNGEEIELTTTEFDFLKAFVTRPNQVLSRQQLMDATKGQDWVCYDRAVDGLVSRLRRKVYPDKDATQSHYIKTVRGIGYMFSP